MENMDGDELRLFFYLLKLEFRHFEFRHFQSILAFLKFSRVFIYRD